MSADKSDMPLEKLLRDETAAQVHNALAQLPEKDRFLLKGRFIDHHTQEQIMTAMDLTDGQYRGQLHRAKKRLRDILSKSSPNEHSQRMAIRDSPTKGKKQ